MIALGWEWSLAESGAVTPGGFADLLADKIEQMAGTESVCRLLRAAVTLVQVNEALDAFYDWADANRIEVNHNALG